MLKEIGTRLRSGALVIIVEEADELLARESAKHAAKQVQPVTVKSAADQDLLEVLENHKTGEGTLIVCDFLRVYGNNPVSVRMVRELALQQRSGDEPYSRLILLETPGVEVPESLKSDVEFVGFKIPTVKELKQELNEFTDQHDIKIGGNGEVRHEIAQSVAGLARHEAARLFARCLIEKNNTLDTIWLRKEKAARIAERLGGALTFVDTGALQVGGLDGLKKWLKPRRAALGSEKAKKFGLPEPKGVLLLGSPGTGKSLTAKVISYDWGLPLLRLDVGKIFGQFVGQSEAQIRQVIQAAEACAPCILWVDEIEKGFAGSSGGGDSGTSQRVFASFLTWLQEKTAPVFIVATANDVSALPPELLRKGRFDEIFFVDLPTKKERVEIVKIHLTRHGRNWKKFLYSEIADVMEGFSGAEIEQAIIDGLFTAFSQDREITSEDIIESARATIPISKTMETQIKALKSWAAGRARMASKVNAVVGVEKAKRPGKGALLQ